jgi:tyrosine-protein kinase Etk/Wzc
MSKNDNELARIWHDIMFWFVPYRFILAISILITSCFGVWYLSIQPPIYEASATLMIKDEKKGYDNSKMVELLNSFTAKKIVENEIEVIRSRTLIKEVVIKLKLYAHMYTSNFLSDYSAYVKSPIIIEVLQPENIIDSPKIPFSYLALKNRVNFDGKEYMIGQWVETKYGNLRFLPNPRCLEKIDGTFFVDLIPTQKMVESLIKGVNISAVNKLSSVLVLNLKDEIPKKAEDILNYLIHSYNNAELIEKNILALNTLKFVDERLRHVATELDSIEIQIQHYRSQKGVVDLPEQIQNLLKNLGENDQKIALLNMQLAVLDEVESNISDKNSQESILPSTLGITDPVLLQLLQRLQTSKSEYEKLRITTGEKNPLVSTLANEIAMIIPDILQNIKIAKNGIKTSLRAVQKTNQDYDNELGKFPENERKLLEISRHQATINNVYNFLLQKKEETALAHAATMTDLRVIDLAESSIKPIKTKKLIMPPVVLVLSLFFTVGYVLKRELINKKLLFRSAIENAFDNKIVAEFPQKDTKIMVLSEALENKLFRNLAISAGFINSQDKMGLTLVCSTISGEGKTYIATNLAKVLLQTGKRVLLLDADFQNRGITNEFGLSAKIGLADFLRREIEIDEIINQASKSPLSVIPAGISTEGASNMLLNGKISVLIKHLVQLYDHVIVNVSPIESEPDMAVFSPFADNILLVLRHDYTPQSVVKTLDGNINTMNLQNVSIVFNGIKSRGLFGNRYGYLEYGFGNTNFMKELA